MAIQRLHFITAFSAVNLLFLCAANLSTEAADGPNRVTSSDVAVGRWMDSLLDPDLKPAPHSRSNRPRTQRRVAQQRNSLRGKLVRNSAATDGTPPFALVDRYGGVLRYVEPVDSVDLKKYLGKAVSVRHDTGDILLASQLALPRTNRSGASVTTGLNLAQHLEPIPAGEPVPGDLPDPVAGEIVGEPILIDGPENGPIYLDGGYEGGYEGEYDSGYGSYDDGLNFGGCPTCGDGLCRQRGSGGCGSGARGVMYVHGEYLLWWLEGMDTPALVTRFSAINPNGGAAIGPFTTIFGRNRTLEDERSGGRITFGLWLDDYGQWGLEGEYLALEDLEKTFVAGVRDGSAPAVGSFIGRPFFNTGVIGAVLPGGRGPAVEDVDTSALDGTVTIDLRSEFQSAGIRLRHNLCCREGCSTGCGDGVGCGGGVGCGSGVGYGGACPIGPLNRLCTLLRKGTRHTDVLYGFRWTNLDESIRIVEDLQDLTAPVSQLDVIDSFATENEFMGGEIGYETDWRYRRWSLGFLTKVAIGNTRQRVDINGSTVINDVAANPPDNIGGLLAQRYVLTDGTVVGNIGTYERDEFSMIPEIGLTAGYNLTPRLKLTAGYTLLYWSNIVRPGDQIDLDVNANLLPRDGGPDVDTVVAGDHPRFEFRQTDLWASGVNFGAEYTW